MNTKRFVIAGVAVFVFLYLYNWLVHGILLAPKYQETASLWREEADFIAHMWWLVFAYIIVAIAFCLLFVGGYEDRGIGEGVRFGVYAGLLLGAVNFITYAVQPIPLDLALSGFVADLVMGVGAGIVAALTYKAEESADTAAAPPQPGPFEPGG